MTGQFSINVLGTPYCFISYYLPHR